ncbi:MAG: SCO7613 C-terminal domain-containing membrane protein, partial [Actinomycetes bacterium]
TLLATRRPVEVADVRMVAGLGGAAGLVLAVADGDRLWTALLALGVGLAVLGIREDPRWGWPAGLLLAASSWVRLDLADVTAPEAYTVPPAVALLAVGLWRRHLDAAYPSWRAYGPGLTLAFVPSLLRAVTDSGDLRPLLLGLAALTVLGLGVARRLQAPLMLGGAVLAVDALVQLAPYLVAAYEVVPRWVTIGLVGLLLLGSGATYEHRVRDLRRVGRHVANMG